MSTNNPKRNTKNKHVALNQNFLALGAANVSQVAGPSSGMPRLPTTGAKRGEVYQHPPSAMASPKRMKLNSPIHVPQSSSPSLMTSVQRFPNVSMASTSSTSMIPPHSVYQADYSLPVAKQNWEELALVIAPEQLKEAILQADSQINGDKEIERMLWGVAKQLREQRNKPDGVLVLTLIYLAKTRPLFFCSEQIIEAFGSLLKSPDRNRLKTNVVPILVINIFYSAFHDEITWPDAFLRFYIEDSLGERVWVDNEECKDFVEILVSCFRTKLPAKSLLQVPDILSFTKSSENLAALVGSSTATASEDSVGGTDEASCSSNPSLFSDKDSLQPNLISRYQEREQFVIDLVTKVIGDHLARLRPQGLTVTSADISRNLIRFLMVTSGVANVRLLIAQKLDNWMQNPKLSRLSQDLLLTLLLNVSPLEGETLGLLMRIKLKGKPLVHSYVNCIKEALKQNDCIFEAMFTIITRNELANIRPNGSNIPLLSQLFLHAPECATIVLARVLFRASLETSVDETSKSLHAFLREFIRSLKVETCFNSLHFVTTLLNDSRALNLPLNSGNEGNFREKIVTNLVDLVVQVLIHSIPPPIRDSFIVRADKVRKFQLQTAEIVCFTIKWIEEVVLTKFTTDTEAFYYCIRRILFTGPVESCLKNDSISDAERNQIYHSIRDVPVKVETILSLLTMGVSMDVPLKPSDSCDLAFELVQRAASIYEGDATAPVLLFSHLGSPFSFVEHFERLVDLMFESTVFIHTEGIVLPMGYVKPKLSYKEPYFKVWLLLVIVAANLPEFGKLAYRLPTFRMLVEMIITSNYQFPPLKLGSECDEILNEEYRLAQNEKIVILEFENYLADKIEINETNSFLLQQTITCDPRSSPRRAVVAFLATDKYRAIVSQTRLCSLLCQCREPDYLLNIIEQQQAQPKGNNNNNNNNNNGNAYGQQQMPWLIELVESKENNFAMLPVDCLAEYLLSQFVDEIRSFKDYYEKSNLQRERRRKLVNLMNYFKDNQQLQVQLILYLAKRLSSRQMLVRRLAYKVLHTMVTIKTENYASIIDGSRPLVAEKEADGWLYDNLHGKHGDSFEACLSSDIVSAVYWETSPVWLTEYLEFLAKVHLVKCDRKLLDNVCLLVLDRRTTFDNIVVVFPKDEHLRNRFLVSLYRIFSFYLELHRQGEVYEASELPSCHYVRFTLLNLTMAMSLQFLHSVLVLLTHYRILDHPHYEKLYILFLLDGNFPQAAKDKECKQLVPLIDANLARRLMCSQADDVIDLAIKNISHEELIPCIESFGISEQAISKMLATLDKSRCKFNIANPCKWLNMLEVHWKGGIEHGYKFARNWLNYKQTRMDIKTEDHGDEAMDTEDEEQDDQHCFKSLKKTDILRWFKNREGRTQLIEISHSLAAEMNDDKVKTKKLTKQFLAEFIANFDVQSENIVQGWFDSTFNMMVTFIVKDKRHSVWNAELQAIRKALQANQMFVDCNLCPILDRCLVKDTGKKSKTTSTPPKDKKKKAKDKIEDTSMARLWTQIAEDLEIERAYQLNTELVETDKPGAVGRNAKHLKTIIFSRNRSYFLSLLLHKSNFATLNNCIKFVLDDGGGGGGENGKDSPDLNATAVLNFLSICLNSPKLWIDRDVDQTQKIVRRQDILQLSLQQMAKLIAFVTTEGDIEHRVDLVIRVCCVNNWKTKFIANLIQDSAQKDSNHRAQYLELYTRIYLQIPSIEYNFNFNATDKQLALIRNEPSYIDKVTNNLLTSFMSMDLAAGGGGGGALASVPSSNPLFRSWELSLTRIASSHPLLFLRQLPIIPAMLSGKMSLVNYEVFKSMGMLMLYKKLMPIMHTLMPYVWHTNMPGVVDVLNLYMDLFMCYYSVQDRQHLGAITPRESNRELVSLLVQFLKLINNWIEHDTEKANIWIAEHRHDFSELAQAYPAEASMIRTVQSGMFSSLLSANPNPFDGIIPTSNRRMELAAKIRDCGERNERRMLLELMDELNKVGDTQPELMQTLMGEIQSFYLNPITCDPAIRLTIKMLQKNPRQARTIVASYLKCLREASPPSICSQALPYLSEIVLLAQDYRYALLQSAFKLAISGNPQALPALLSAHRALNTQFGC